MGAFLLPVSNLLPMMQYMAERFLYLPLVGWLLVLAWLISRLRLQHLQRVAMIGVLLLWTVLSWQRSFIWKDELTLFVQSSLEGPRTPRVDENAVAAIFHLPEIRSLFRLDKATRTLTSIGPVTAEKAELAAQKLTEGLRLFPRDEQLLTALGIMHAALRHTNEAVTCFESVVLVRTNDARYWNNLAMAALDAGNLRRAHEAVEQGLALDPKNVNVLRSASRLYWQDGDFSAAIAVLKRLQEEEPNNPEHGYWIRQATQKLATRSSR
jgi:tetratricopeptide (TPR) repeat protein